MSPKPSRFPLAHWMVGLASVLISMSPANAIVSETSPALTGAGFSPLDGVGKLILTRSDGAWGCSGSLLSGGLYVLTAAHCVSGEAGTATTSSIAFSLKGGIVTASTSTYYVNPSWSGDIGSGNDLALVKLSQAIASVAGYTFYSSSAQGSQILLAGYGDIGTGASGYTANTFGTLHYGYNTYDADSSFYSQSGASSSVYFYDFDSGQRADNLFGSRNPVANEATTSPGDSGGGSFVLVNGVWELAGVHSFIACTVAGCTPNSSFGQLAGDVSVSANSAWLNGYLAPVPEPATYAMMLAGLGVLAATARRRKQTKQ